jgi:hypothetical protein
MPAIILSDSDKRKKGDPRSKKKEDSVNAILKFLDEEREVPKKREEEEDEELAFLFQELE